jgi:predicted RNase H-like HicB family nuclease
MLLYPAQIILDKNDNYIVVFPDFDAAVGEGASLERALKVAKQNLIRGMESDMRIKEHILKPTAGISPIMVAIPPALEKKLRNYPLWVTRPNQVVLEVDDAPEGPEENS